MIKHQSKLFWPVVKNSSRENGDISLNNGEESCKSNDIEPDYPRQRRNSVKVSPYSEEGKSKQTTTLKQICIYLSTIPDTQMTGDQTLLNKKANQENVPQHCKKRRKSLRNSDDSAPPPTKKNKKSLNRSRQNSDSDDTSEHSNGGASGNSMKTSNFNRGERSPRPSKYNFFVELGKCRNIIYIFLKFHVFKIKIFFKDPSLDSTQRIAVLTQKLSELRKTYADVKAELAAVERRRKKIRRREREGKKYI